MVETFTLEPGRGEVEKEVRIRSKLGPKEIEALTERMGGTVKVTGTAVISMTRRSGFGSRAVTSQVPFEGEPILVKPDGQILAALQGMLPPPPATKSVPSEAGSTASLGSSAASRFGSRIVVAEGRYEVNLAVAKQAIQVYRHGFRISEREVVLPAEIGEPWRLAAQTLSLQSLLSAVSSPRLQDTKVRGWVTEGESMTLTSGGQAMRFKRSAGTGWAVYEFEDVAARPEQSGAGRGATGT